MQRLGERDARQRRQHKGQPHSHRAGRVLPCTRTCRAPWGGGDSAVHRLIVEEFARATRAVLAITGQTELLDNNPVIQSSISERNPDTDRINALQVELIARCRETESGDDRQQLQMLVLLSLNALAAAMQSTG